MQAITTAQDQRDFQWYDQDLSAQEYQELLLQDRDHDISFFFKTKTENKHQDIY